MVSGDDHRRFLLRVLPWPGDNTPGYVNLHWSHKKPDGKRMWSGKPFRDVDNFISMADWVVRRPEKNDVYMCLSSQAQHGVGKTSGKPTAVRLQQNVVAVKALWVDLDVATPGIQKGKPEYATLSDALAALQKFIAATELPPPSALIKTGGDHGGLHVYWISKTPLTREQWQPYAEGLKVLLQQHNILCDTQCTIDSARILRVPGTFNHKIEPSRPVILGGLGVDYDFPEHFQFLTTMAPPPKIAGSLVMIDPSKFPRRVPAAGEPTDSLTDGIEREELPPLDPAPIIKGCPFFRKAFATGGAQYSQPLWNLTTLGSTFMDHGDKLAHAFGNKHPGYTQQSTDELYARKQREREQHGLGWPSCKAIADAGCKDCALCPHFAKGKSPMHLALATPPTSPAAMFTAAVTSAPPAQSPMLLPEGYGFNDVGYLCKVVEVEGLKGAAPEYSLVPLFQCQISNVWVQASPRALNFTVSLDKGHTANVSIKMEEMGPFELVKTLYRQGVKIVPRNKQFLEDFLMAWLTKLHEAQSAHKSQPFGWHAPDGKVEGFSYGGVVIKSDGSEVPSGFADLKLQERYQPKGSLDPWLAACKMITDQKRPALQCIIAAAFAAPLIRFTGEKGAFMAAYGESGGNKSSALQVGCAVWGRPSMTKGTTTTTRLSLAHQLGQIQNLPFYWDEIRDGKPQENAVDIAFDITLGAEGSRLTSDIRQRERGEWQTICLTASNLNMGDVIVRKMKTTSAGLYRVFEFEVVHPGDEFLGKIDVVSASRMLQELESNYGMIGQQYARMLATDPAIDKFVTDTVHRFGDLVDCKMSERYWVACAGSLIAGAQLANRMGCEFDIEDMVRYLYDAFMKLRARVVDEAVEVNSTDNSDNVLNNFFTTFYDATLYTDQFGAKHPGNPGLAHGPVTVLKPPLDARKAPRVQVSVGERKIYFSRRAFTDHLNEQGGISAYAVIRALRANYGVVADKRTLGSGTPFRTSQEHILVLPVPAGSAYEDFMNRYTVPTDAPPQTPAVA